MSIKKVYLRYYVHKSNLQELFSLLPYLDVERIKRVLVTPEIKNFDWCIFRYDIKTKEISVIKSSNWDSANEPDIEESIKVTFDDKITFVKARGQIYHSKELFVADNYTGFDIEKAKVRTKLWNAIPNLNKNKIGWKKYWINLLTENNIEK